jgi:protein disulfide-isomerase
MRLIHLLSTLALPFLLSSAEPKAESTADSSDDGENAPKSTTFNGQEVPPIKFLSPKTFDEDISKGNWYKDVPTVVSFQNRTNMYRLVEYFSPYCGHCKHFAPVLQTAYEYYYTSNPVPGKKQASDNLNSFTRYYDFKFAKVDCVAYSDLCVKKEAHAFPSLILYKDGQEVKKTTGAMSMKELSKWIEDCLETIRPGSRPKDGVKLPKVGDHSVDVDAQPEEPEEKDKDKAAGSSAAIEHNAKATEAPKKGTDSGNEASKKTPNPDGISVNLDAEKFQRMVTATWEPWFIKFYAPWCHHCQMMAPNWAQMAKEMKGKLNVGEVNCEVERRLCKDAHVNAYPTILFFRGGERVEYDGLRGIGDLISFANKAYVSGNGVVDVDFDEFTKMEETEEVIFVYFYDHATTSEDFAALERLTLSLVGHARLVKTKDERLYNRFRISTWPRLMVSRDGKPSYYPPLAPKDMRDVHKLLTWMKTVWNPIVPELTSSNAREVMDGHLVVLGILDRNRGDDFESSRREIKNAALEWIDKQTHMMQLEREELRNAKQLRIEEAEDRNDQRALRNAKLIRINMDEIEKKQVRFAWVDGVFWERWIRTTYGINVHEGERVIINDEDVSTSIWHNNSSKNYA